MHLTNRHRLKGTGKSIECLVIDSDHYINRARLCTYTTVCMYTVTSWYDVHWVIPLLFCMCYKAEAMTHFGCEKLKHTNFLLLLALGSCCLL